ncbi:MAG: FHA domain-containing protein [Planctomycetota bacterium]|nr:MAG: FHA domain-containing protein [Planctomycetota bacterium]
MKRVRLRLRGAVEGWFEVDAADPLLFGRATEARARLDDRRCSRVHCRIELGPEGLEVVDLGSRNGTWLDERPITRAPLPERCRLRLGDSVIEVRVLGAAEHASASLCVRCGRDLSGETFSGVVDPALAGLCGGCAARAVDRGAVFDDALRRELGALGFRSAVLLERDGLALRLHACRMPLEQPVRLTVLPLEALGGPEPLRRARAAAQLVHPGIVRLVDVRQGPRHLVFAYEEVEGASLRDELERCGGRLEPARVLAIALAVSDALVHAHEHGVLHGALRPSQVLLGVAGEVRLIGVGIGGLERPGNAGIDPAALPYAAPEVADGRCSPDVRAEIHAVGALMYHMLTGRAPRAGLLGDEQPPPPVAALAAGVPDTLAALIERCLDPLPHNRPQTARLLRTALEEELRRYYGVLSADAMLLARLAANAGPRPGDAFEETTRHVRNFRADGGVTRFGGRFRGDELCDLLQMLELNDKSGRVSVIDPDGEPGEIVLRYGRVIEARYGARSGQDAVRALLALETGHFGVVLGPVADLVTTSGFALGPLLLEAAMQREGGADDRQAGVA